MNHQPVHPSEHVFDSLESAGEPRPRPEGGVSFGFILLPSFTLIAFASFLSVLRQAADIGDRSRQVLCHWTIMSTDLKPVSSSCGVQVAPWEVLPDPRRFDYVVVVGGLLGQVQHYQPEVLRYLEKAAEAGVNLVGLCTGSFYLARAGLMRGYRCCVHWYHFQDFINEFPDMTPDTDRIFVIDRQRITCPGGMSATDLALFLVEKHLGRERTLKCQRHLLMDWGRPSNHPQLPLASDFASIANPQVRKAVYLMEQGIAERLSVADLAAQTRISPRQLERLFRAHTGQGPGEYFRGLRLKYGRWLLGNTQKSVTEIAYDCGFSDAAHFCRWFKKAWSISPAAFRKAGLHR